MQSRFNKLFGHHIASNNHITNNHTTNNHITNNHTTNNHTTNNHATNDHITNENKPENNNEEEENTNEEEEDTNEEDEDLKIMELDTAADKNTAGLEDETDHIDTPRIRKKLSLNNTNSHTPLTPMAASTNTDNFFTPTASKISIPASSAASTNSNTHPGTSNTSIIPSENDQIPHIPHTPSTSNKSTVPSTNHHIPYTSTPAPRKNRSKKRPKLLRSSSAFVPSSAWGSQSVHHYNTRSKARIQSLTDHTATSENDTDDAMSNYADGDPLTFKIVRDKTGDELLLMNIDPNLNLKKINVVYQGGKRKSQQFGDIDNNLKSLKQWMKDQMVEIFAKLQRDHTQNRIKMHRMCSNITSGEGSDSDEDETLAERLGSLELIDTPTSQKKNQNNNENKNKNQKSTSKRKSGRKVKSQMAPIFCGMQDPENRIKVQDIKMYTRSTDQVGPNEQTLRVREMANLMEMVLIGHPELLTDAMDIIIKKKVMVDLLKVKNKFVAKAFEQDCNNAIKEIKNDIKYKYLRFFNCVVTKTSFRMNDATSRRLGGTRKYILKPGMHWATFTLINCIMIKLIILVEYK